MRSLNFKSFFEATDIFGFDPKPATDEAETSGLQNPVKQFDTELMMELLSKKSLGPLRAQSQFMNEIKWGGQPGAVKLEVDTGYTFYIKKLAMDKRGQPRWVTKKAFQLNRQGYGGYEDAVAQEIYEHLRRYAESNIESPVEDYKDLESLVQNIYGKIKRTSKSIFIPEGVKKLSDDAYVIKLGVRGSGLEARDQQRVEQNQTMVTYDRSQGTIRITNYNLLSPTGKGHQFRINQNDFDLYFLPTQDRDEISDTVAVHLRYY